MTREEFLKELRIALQGRISQSQVNEQLHYYENYIIEESRKGRTEEEVIAEIGNPRLVAKTLIDLYGDEMHQNGDHGMYETGKGAGAAQKRRKLRLDWFPFHTWYGRILSGIAVILLLMLLVKIGIFLMPIIASAVLAGGIVYIIYMVFFGKK